MKYLLAFTVMTFTLRAQDETPDISKLSGKEIYVQFCSRCHGDDGKGQIPEEMLLNMEAPPPDLTQPYFSSGEKRKSWHRVIKYGGDIEGLSMSMPSWGDSFSDRQIDEMVEHMKTFVPQEEYPQGETNFLRAHSVTKAFVEQEALIIPTYTSRTVNGASFHETSTTFYYANRFGNRFQYEAKIPVRTISSPLQNDAGFGNLELGIKYALADDYAGPSIISVGFETELPTGSESKGFSSGTIIAIPYAAAGFGVGVAEFQGSIKVEAPFDRSKASPELKYGMSSTFVLSDSRLGFFPGVELSATKNLSTDEHLMSVIPKLYVGLSRRGHIAVSFGREIPISGKPFDARWLAFFLWDYADGGIWW